MAEKLKVTLVRSTIGTSPKQRKVVEDLTSIVSQGEERALNFLTARRRAELSRK